MVYTYTLVVTSNNNVAIGIMNRPNQNTGDANIIRSIPTNTAATGIVGHKLLYIIMKTNQRPIEPHIEQCVNHVHEFVIKPAFKHTVTTTY